MIGKPLDQEGLDKGKIKQKVNNQEKHSKPCERPQENIDSFFDNFVHTLLSIVLIHNRSDQTGQM